MILPTALGISFSFLPPGGITLSFATLIEFAKNFFRQLFLDPGKNFYFVIVFAAVAVLIPTGVAFLVKRAYDHWCI